MSKYLFLTLSCVFFFTSVANAKQAEYQNDEKFMLCTEKTDDFDLCTKELFNREMGIVKSYYLNILSSPELSDWQGSKESNKETLKDMFDSWAAFRNRRCSLEKAADTYVVTFQDPEIGCNAYLAAQQRDFLGNILYTINGKNKNNPYKKTIATEPEGYEFLKTDKHDDNYEVCLKDPNKKRDDCVREEIKREENQIKDLYNSLLSDAPTTKKWNNGPDMSKGNFRDMFDSWIAYRNRLCSLAVFAQKKALKENAVSSDDCILFMDKEKRGVLEDLLFAAYTVLDDDAVPDNPEDEEGGEELGQKIKPLKAHISATPAYEEEKLTNP